jgi:serine/threonine protein kinase
VGLGYSHFRNVGWVSTLDTFSFFVLFYFLPPLFLLLPPPLLTFLITVTSYPPFFDDHPFHIYEKILEGRIVFPTHFTPAARDLVRKLLTADRTRRLGNLRGGAEDVKKHPWFAGVDWERVYRREIIAPIVPEIAGPGDSSNFEKYPDEDECPAPMGAAPLIAPVGDPYRHLFDSF